MRPKIIATTALAVVLAAPCVAQSRPSGGVRPDIPPIANDLDAGVNQLKQFGIYDVFKDRVKRQKGQTKSIAELLAQDKTDALALVASMKLQCTVVNAVLTAEDASAHTKTFEVACASGAGYFLVQNDLPSAPLGFSCFAAETARLADLAAKRQPGTACGLPENPGSKPMATAILQRAGKICAVRDTKWHGQSATTDFLEVACQEGPGFVVRSPLPGSQSPPHVDTCIDLVRIGFVCTIPGNDPVLATHNAALALHKVSCDAEAVHVIGHEAIKRREVVEYFCPKQQPNGLVAFLPAEGSTEPFEALDCTAAAKRKAICTLTKPN